MEGKTIDHLCSNVYKIYAMWEYPQRSLSAELNERALQKRRFEEKELWSILASLILGMSTLQKHKLKHESLNTKNILLDNDGLVKVADPLAAAAPTNLDIIYHNRHAKSIYLSPEQCEALDSRSIFSNPYKNDVWSMGMVLLECGLLERQDHCYRDEYQRLDYDLLHKNVRRFGLEYSEELRIITELMLKPDNKDRPDWLDLEQYARKSTDKSEVIEPADKFETANKSPIYQYHSKPNNTSLSFPEEEPSKADSAYKVQVPPLPLNSNYQLPPSIRSETYFQPPPYQQPLHPNSNPHVSFAPSQYQYQPSSLAQQPPPTIAQQTITQQPSSITQQPLSSITQQPSSVTQQPLQLPTQQSLQPPTQQPLTQQPQQPQPPPQQFYQPKSEYQPVEPTSQNYMVQNGSLFSSPPPQTTSIIQQSSPFSSGTPIHQNFKPTEMLSSSPYQTGPPQTPIQPVSLLPSLSQLPDHRRNDFEFNTFGKAYEKKEYQPLLGEKREPRMSPKLAEQPPRKDELEYVIETFKQGSRYEGYKCEDMRHGEGKFFYQDGGMYDGSWSRNKMHGFGSLYYQSGKLAYQGMWREDQFQGKGKLFNEAPEKLERFFDYRNFDEIDEYWEYYEGTCAAMQATSWGTSRRARAS